MSDHKTLRDWKTWLATLPVALVLVVGAYVAWPDPPPRVAGLSGDVVEQGQVVFFRMVETDAGAVVAGITYGTLTPEAVQVDNAGNGNPSIVSTTGSTRIHTGSQILSKDQGEWASPVAAGRWIAEPVLDIIAGSLPGPGAYAALAEKHPEQWQPVFARMEQSGPSVIPLRGEVAERWSVDVDYQTAMDFALAAVPDYAAAVESARFVGIPEGGELRAVDDPRLEEAKYTLTAWTQGGAVIAVAVTVDVRAFDAQVPVQTIGTYAIAGSASVSIPTADQVVDVLTYQRESILYDQQASAGM